MPATAYTSVHGVERVRVKNYHPKNNNAIELHLIQKEVSEKESGHWFELTVFGLDEDAAIALVKALGDAETTVYGGAQHQNLTDYLVAKGVFDAIEGK